MTAVLWVTCPGDASADETHGSVFFEGHVGPYQARITIRPPGVVPGLAEVSVRVLDGEVREVTALPVKWNTGKKGAPPPDVALPVRGETNLYSAALWFMETGSHSVEVTLRGDRGEGRMFIPVNSIATRVLNLSPGLAAGLGAMGVLLCALLVSIIGAAVREGVVTPGQAPSRGRRWASRGAMIAAAAALVALLWGGSLWWELEAREYRGNRLYRSRPLTTTVEKSREGRLLRLGLEEKNPSRYSPLVPDHGRLMHLFLVDHADMKSMAHLHPVRVNRAHFETTLPDLPEGNYDVYAQVTYETGFSETLTNRVTLPAPEAQPPHRGDPEDAWWAGSIQRGNVSDLGDGYSMELKEDPARSGQRNSLPFEVRSPGGEPAALDMYLGMPGHLFLRSTDGQVFAHLHPGGSFSMAAQQLFELRDAGKAPSDVNFGANDPLCQLPDLDSASREWMKRVPLETSGRISFPYEFPRDGDYRVWVQVKTGGKIRTGAFDVSTAKSP